MKRQIRTSNIIALVLFILGFITLGLETENNKALILIPIFLFILGFLLIIITPLIYPASNSSKDHGGAIYGDSDSNGDIGGID